MFYLFMFIVKVYTPTLTLSSTKLRDLRVEQTQVEPNLSFTKQGLNEKTSLKRDVFSTMLRE